MTLKEKKSKRKAEAIKYLVDSGEYSTAYALIEAERLNDEGKILDVDYEPLAEYLEELMNKEVEVDDINVVDNEESIEPEEDETPAEEVVE